MAQGVGASLRGPVGLRRGSGRHRTGLLRGGACPGGFVPSRVAEGGTEHRRTLGLRRSNCNPPQKRRTSSEERNETAAWETICLWGRSGKRVLSCLPASRQVSIRAVITAPSVFGEFLTDVRTSCFLTLNHGPGRRWALRCDVQYGCRRATTTPTGLFGGRYKDFSASDPVGSGCVSECTVPW